MSRERETALVEQNRTLVRTVAARRFPRWLYDDDLLQCGLVGLWEAARKWDGTRNFAAFARTCIYRNMLDHVRSKAAQASGEEMPENLSYEDVHHRLDDLDLLERISGAFPPGTREHIILTELALGADKKDLAQCLNLETAQMTRIAKRAAKRVI